MKSYISITSVFMLFFVLNINNLFAYGYKIDKDPLIKVFKEVVFFGKNDDWDQIVKQLESINDRIKDVHILFDVDLEKGLNDAIKRRDLQDLIKIMANFVLLAMDEKFYWNLDEKLMLHNKAKVRLRLAEEYYTRLLSGNVRAYDLKNGSNINTSIYQLFIEGHKSIGSLGFFGVGGINPDLDKFSEITNKIKEYLITVFPYFVLKP